MGHQNTHGVFDVPGYKIPFKFDGLLYPVPVIYVSINDSELRPFIVDTGTNLPLIIDTTTAEQLKLDLSQHDTEESAFGPLRLAHLRSVQFCGSDMRNHLRFRGSPWAFVADLASIVGAICPERIAGIIGMPAIKGAIAMFDFDTKTLTLTWDTARSVRTNVRWVALQEFHDTFLVDVTVAQEASVKLLLDTGAMGSSLPSTTAKPLHFARTTYRLYLTARGVVCRRKVLVPSVAVGGRTVREVGMSLREESLGLRSKGSLGLDFLSRFNVLLDLRRHRLALLPRAKDIAHPSVRGVTGIDVDKAEGRVYVKEVSQWSPARDTSLQPGDTLFAVDGHRIADFPIAVIQRVIEGWSGTEAKLITQKGKNKMDTVRFRRLGEFDRPVKLRIDCDLIKRPGHPLTVLSVHPSGNVAMMLEAGDQILQIDGRATAPMEATSVFAILTEPSEATEITVRRGDSKTMTFKIPR